MGCTLSEGGDPFEKKKYIYISGTFMNDEKATADNIVQGKCVGALVSDTFLHLPESVVSSLL